METRQKGIKHKKSVLTEVNIENVKNNIKEFPSVRKLEVKTGINRGSVHNILKNELNYFPYKVQIGQTLTKDSEKKRVEFCEKMLKRLETDPDFIHKIWFTDESHFYLNGFVNKQNMRIWGTEKPDAVVEIPAHAEYVTVWTAISSQGIIGPYFFENSNGKRETVRQENYQQMIENYFVPTLQGLVGEEEFENQIFMQDGASPHTARNTMILLEKYFGSRIISNKSEDFWPPHSPDLNKCDFYLWGYVKDRVYSQKPKTCAELKLKISEVLNGISEENLKKVTDNLIVRLKCCILKKGKHFANIVKQYKNVFK